ncbi:MAG: hypothetical protein ACRCWJ_22335 [Casimicrobium sp.]
MTRLLVLIGAAAARHLAVVALLTSYVVAPMAAASTDDAARYGPTAQVWERRGSQTAYVHTENTVLLTSRKPRSLQDAKSVAITEVKDGDPLWLYVHTAKPLKHYLRYDPDARPDQRTWQIEVILGSTMHPDNQAQGLWRGQRMDYPVSPSEMEGRELAIALANPMGVKADTSTLMRKPDERIYRDANLFLREVAHNDQRRGIYDISFYVADHTRSTHGIDWMAAPQLIGAAKLTVRVPDGLPKYKLLREQSGRCVDGRTKKVSSPCVVQ